MGSIHEEEKNNRPKFLWCCPFKTLFEKRPTLELFFTSGQFEKNSSKIGDVIFDTGSMK
jgi:hypothetical protein